MNKISVDDLLTFLSASGIHYTVIDRDKAGRRARIKVQPENVPKMSVSFLGTRPYRDVYGRSFMGRVVLLSGRIFDVSV